MHEVITENIKLLKKKILCPPLYYRQYRKLAIRIYLFIYLFYHIPLLDGSVDRRLENMWREKILVLSCFLEASLETAAAAQPRFLLKQCVLSSGAQWTTVTGAWLTGEVDG